MRQAELQRSYFGEFSEICFPAELSSFPLSSKSRTILEIISSASLKICSFMMLSFCQFKYMTSCHINKHFGYYFFFFVFFFLKQIRNEVETMGKMGFLPNLPNFFFFRCNPCTWCVHLTYLVQLCIGLSAEKKKTYLSKTPIFPLPVANWQRDK